MTSSIKIAIHHERGSFSERWINYCSEHGIDYVIVNCYDFNIMNQLLKCDGLLWHWNHADPKDQLMARQLIVSIEKMGIKIFPNIDTCWHFDDKIGQKYLLESINAPFVPTYVFYGEDEAMAWIDKSEFPKVFKLRCGAGSSNVKLINTKKEAKKYVKKAFNEGFSTVSNYFSDTKTKVRKTKNIKLMIKKLKHLPRSLYNIYRNNKFLQRQLGYIYFQDFLPNNNFDTRITVIGNRAFGFTRNTRPNDFRASGSGDIDYDQNRIAKSCIKIAFDTVEKLKTQSLAFDFVFDQKMNPKIVEISYCYLNRAIYNCSGYWDYELNFHIGQIWPEDAILEDFIREIIQK